MLNENNFHGKVAIVTGGAGGIGYSIGKLFTENGARVFLFDMRSDVDVIAKNMDSSLAVGLKVDITDKNEILESVNKIIEQEGKIDILINSAGIALLDKAEDLTVEDWEKTMDINLKGSFLTAQAVGKVMIQQRYGKIINIASQAGIVGFDRHVAYTASKAAVIGMTKVMAMEWAKYNINVNAISPTIIMTELGKKAWAGKVGEDMMKEIPLKRFGIPEEISACALFLASDSSSLVTGANLVADGGYTIK